MQVLNPTYTLRVEVKDVLPSPQNGFVGASVSGPVFSGQATSAGPNGRKWFNPAANKTGCDEVLALVRDALVKAGISADISFEKFEHR